MVWLSLVLLGIGGLILIFSNKPVVQDTPIPVEEQTNAPVAEIPAEEPGSNTVVRVAEEIPTPTVSTNKVVKFTMRPKLKLSAAP